VSSSSRWLDKYGRRWERWYMLWSGVDRYELWACSSLLGLWCFRDWSGAIVWESFTRRVHARRPDGDYLEDEIVKWIKTKTGKQLGAKGGPPCTDPLFVEQCPAVGEFMTLAVGEKNAKRETSTLMVNISEGRVNVGLHDREDETWLWRSGETLIEAIQAIDSAIQDGTADWRGTRGKKGK
jgi:hypothetical protein